MTVTMLTAVTTIVVIKNRIMCYENDFSVNIIIYTFNQVDVNGSMIYSFNTIAVNVIAYI